MLVHESSGKTVPPIAWQVLLDGRVGVVDSDNKVPNGLESLKVVDGRTSYVMLHAVIANGNQ